MATAQSLPLSQLSSVVRSHSAGLWKLRGAYHKLKRCFTYALVLTLPDPEKLFTLEVDNSNIGVVLSRYFPRAHQTIKYTHVNSSLVVSLPPRGTTASATKSCGPLNYHLKNSVTGYRTYPFLSLSGLTIGILEYLHSAKRLNPLQAHWSSFFNPFNFTLTFGPGTNNVKPEALSRIPANPEKCPVPVLPPGTLVTATSCKSSVQ